MSVSTISAFETTTHKTNVWLKDLLMELGWENESHERAFHTLRTVLHALRDRLGVNESNDLASQLPMLIRGFYYETWIPEKTPVKERHREQFLEHIMDAFGNHDIVDAERIVRGVFRVLRKHISVGEINDVRHALPESIRQLFDD